MGKFKFHGKIAWENFSIMGKYESNHGKIFYCHGSEFSHFETSWEIGWRAIEIMGKCFHAERESWEIGMRVND